MRAGDIARRAVRAVEGLFEARTSRRDWLRGAAAGGIAGVLIGAAAGYRLAAGPDQPRYSEIARYIAEHGEDQPKYSFRYRNLLDTGRLGNILKVKMYSVPNNMAENAGTIDAYLFVGTDDTAVVLSQNEFEAGPEKFFQAVAVDYLGNNPGSDAAYDSARMAVYSRPESTMPAIRWEAFGEPEKLGAGLADAVMGKIRERQGDLAKIVEKMVPPHD